MEVDSKWVRMKYGIQRYLWEAKRGVLLKKIKFYRELSPLDRIFNMKDCTLIGYGSLTGVGLHLLSMSCIQAYGSMMLFSVVITAMWTIFTGMCYAELASLAPSTGAVYHYCYHTIGELVGFLVGWNMILSCCFCCSYVLKYLSKFMDCNFFNYFIKCGCYHLFGERERLSLEFFTFSKEINILSFVISMFIAGMNSMLVETAKTLNNWIVIVSIVFTYLCYLLYFLFASFKNFTDSQPITKNTFEFFSCASSHMAYSFSGFEVVSCMGEEAIEPSKTIPSSILVSIKFASVSYILMFFLHRLVWPFKHPELFSPVSYVLIQLGLWPSNHLANIAATTGMWASAFACMFMVIRITYAMSRDGLIPKVFCKVNQNTKSPLITALISGFVIGLSGMFISEKTLATVSELGLIFSRLMAAVCLLITRYRCESCFHFLKDEKPRWYLINYPNRQNTPTKATQNIANLLILNLVMSSISMILLIRSGLMYNKFPYLVKSVAVLSVVLFLLLATCLYQQPQNDRKNLNYMVRGVPTIPILTIVVDVYTMTTVGTFPWVTFIIWTALGLLFYFCYSVTHSIENRMRHADGRLWSCMRSSVHIDTISLGQESISHKTSRTSDEEIVIKQFTKTESQVKNQEQQKNPVGT